MSTFEAVSLVVAVLALLVSLYTAYKTLLPRSEVSVFVRSRCFLTRTEAQPSIVVGVDVANVGNKPSSIEDMYLAVKYIQNNTNIDKSSIVGYQQSNKISKVHPFFPALMRDEYNVIQTYQSGDFEMFNTILIPSNTRFAKFVVFIPNEGFSYFSGDMELILFYRLGGSKVWSRGLGQSRFPVEERFMKIWQDPQGKTLITQSTETEEIRTILLNNDFRDI